MVQKLGLGSTTGSLGIVFLNNPHEFTSGQCHWSWRSELEMLTRRAIGVEGIYSPETRWDMESHGSFWHPLVN